MFHVLTFSLLAVFLIAMVDLAGAQESRTPLSKFKDCDVCPEMVVIPPGSFVMGSDKVRDEGPQHLMHMQAFAIGVFETTFSEYDVFAEATGRPKPSDEGWGRGHYPVINVSSEDAEAYADWLTKRTGAHYRLPTAAEWEYAARAGSTTAYPWGDDVGSNLANCNGCGSQWDSMQTAPVGSFSPNDWGLHDSVGNVWEWTCSTYENRYAGMEAKCGNGDGSYRTTRGGSWKHPPRKARSTAISRVAPQIKFNRLGFRLVREL